MNLFSEYISENFKTNFAAKTWNRSFTAKMNHEKMCTLGSLLMTLFEAQGGHLYDFRFDNSKKNEKMFKEKSILSQKNSASLIQKFVSVSKRSMMNVYLLMILETAGNFH